MADAKNQDSDPAPSRSFARKVRLSTLALVFERLWPRLWLLIGLGLIFAALSFLGLWLYLDGAVHKIVLAAFGLAAVAAVVYAARIPWPTREEAIRRIERRSDVPHRPATSYEDTLSSGATNAATSALWQAHRERLARAIARLRVGPPSPRTDRFDPWALRSLTVLLLIPAALLVTGSLGDRLASAFRFGVAGQGTPKRVDAWVTPPPYTALPPVLLADGAQQAPTNPDEQKSFFEIPDRSLLTLRGVGFANKGVSLEVLSVGASEPVTVAPEKVKPGDTSNVSEVRYEIRKSSRIRALSGSTELGQWTFDVVADALPKISLKKDISGTPRGSMRVAYEAEDDYGLASARVKVQQLKPKAGDPSKAWARPRPVERSALASGTAARTGSQNSPARRQKGRYLDASRNRRASRGPGSASNFGWRRPTSPARSAAASRSRSCCLPGASGNPWRGPWSNSAANFPKICATGRWSSGRSTL